MQDRKNHEKATRLEGLRRPSGNNNNNNGDDNNDDGGFESKLDIDFKSGHLHFYFFKKLLFL